MKKKGRVQKMLTVLNNLKHFCPISSLFKNSNSSRSVFKARSKAPSVLKHLRVFLKLTKLNTTLMLVTLMLCLNYITNSIIWLSMCCKNSWNSIQETLFCKKEIFSIASISRGIKQHISSSLSWNQNPKQCWG